MRTFSQKPAEVTRTWYLIDATGVSFGRIAAQAASFLIGKGKPTVTPHTDGGDYVIVVNAKDMKITGGKETKKTYYRHSGYPGGIYKRSLNEQMARDANSILSKAIRGMLPDNKLRTGRLARLKIYQDDQHNHSAQKPVEFKMKDNK